MSETTPSEPSVVASTTASPPLVSGLFSESRNCTVMVEVETPSAVMDEGAAEISEVVESAGRAGAVFVGVGEMVGLGVGEVVGDAVGEAVGVGFDVTIGIAAPEKL